MKEFSLQTGPVPAVTAYPKTFSGFIDFLSNYVFFEDKINPKIYTISPTKPANISSDSDKTWFQSKVSTEEPVVPRIYTAGFWESFDDLKQGDLVLTAEGTTIESPWGEPNGTIYNVIKYPGSGANTTVAYTTPSAATAPPPTGFKYKVYVGYY